jgi:hypothetical protein
MKYAQILVLPQIPPGGLTVGIDWASAGHAVCVVDAAGQVRARFSVAHDKAGIGKLITGLRTAGVSETAIERSMAAALLHGRGPALRPARELALAVGTNGSSLGRAAGARWQ